MRAILDPNVIISGLLSPRGAPAEVFRAWLDGELELIVSPLLLAELGRALAYPRLSERILPGEARELIAWLEREATVVPDPERAPSLRSADPDDDYLIALAEATRGVLVSGDRHLLALGDRMPILPPRRFLDELRGA